jgi:hypothetical protein
MERRIGEKRKGGNILKKEEVIFIIVIWLD